MKEPHHNIAFLTCKLFPLLCVIVRKLHSRSASTRKKKNTNHPYYYAWEWHLLWFTRFHIFVAIHVIEWIRHVYSDYKRLNQQIPIVLHPNWSNQMRLYCDWNINAACGLLHKWINVFLADQIQASTLSKCENNRNDTTEATKTGINLAEIFMKQMHSTVISDLSIFIRNVGWLVSC